MNRHLFPVAIRAPVALPGATTWLATIALALVTVSCGSDTVCPGHVDPSRGAGLVIQTSDYSPTIASVQFRTDPSAIVGSSSCSYFTLERPDASTSSGYSQVTVYMGSSIFIDDGAPWDADPAPCQIDVVSVAGQSVTVTATMIFHHRTNQHCAGNSNCCSKSGLEWLGYREFYPRVQTVPFTQSADAVDGATETSSLDHATGLDGGIDAPGA